VTWHGTSMLTKELVWQTLRNRALTILPPCRLAGAASLVARIILWPRPPHGTTTLLSPKALSSATRRLISPIDRLRAEDSAIFSMCRQLRRRRALPRGGGGEASSAASFDFAMSYIRRSLWRSSRGSPDAVSPDCMSDAIRFAHEGIRTIRDLKGKTLGVGFLPQQSLIAAWPAYVGLDPVKDIECFLTRSRPQRTFCRAQDRLVPRLPPEPS